MNKFTLPPDTRLDAALAQNFPELLSRSQAQKLIKEGRVRAQGAPIIKSSFTTDAPLEVDFDYTPEEPYELKPNDKGVPVVYQDDHIAVIHKPPGMTVHPGAGSKEDTLVHSLIAQLETLSESADPLRPGIVHRLDRETEGLLVVAKTNLAHRLLAEDFANRRIIKEYHAWVWGHTEPAGVLEGFIGRHRTLRRKMVFLEQPPNDSTAPTYREASLEYHRLNTLGPFSLLKIALHTGRTHQIRASLSHINRPVVGDQLYSRLNRRKANSGLPEAALKALDKHGMLLAATRLSFEHPATHKRLDFSLPLPQRFNLDSIAGSNIT